MSATNNTVKLHRVLRAPAKRIYSAFLNAQAIAKWFPPHGFTCKVDELDARVGGQYRMAFTNFSAGQSHSFRGKYLELVPGERLRYTAQFDDPNLPGEITTTVVLRDVGCGTAIDIVQEGIPAVIPADSCYLGWQETLSLLTLLVEPEIPAGS